MLLRTRISLVVTIAFAIVCVSIVFVGYEREDLFRAQYSSESVADQLSLWSKVNTEIIQRIQDSQQIVTRHQRFIRAVENRDNVAVQALGRGLTEELLQPGTFDRFDVVFADGSLAFSSKSAVFQSSVIQADIAKDLVANNLEASGIGNDLQHNIALVFGFPLHSSRIPLHTSGNRAVGMGIFSADIATAITEMERITNSKVIFVNRRGRLIYSSDDALWEELHKLVDLGKLKSLQTIDTEDRYFSVNVLEQAAGLAGLIGRLVIVKDITSLVHQQQNISQTSGIAIVIFLILLALGLYFYMLRSFSPLIKSVEVLHALSQGDLQAQIEHTTAKDEVGQISNAVNVFRSDLITINQFRRSRERQRARQERFIFREMTQLADTLDDGEREEILEELEQFKGNVQHISSDMDQQERSMMVAHSNAADLSDRKSDNLALMAAAFQNMSNRVQDQHRRLLDALQTKEALISIRKELDIATRVQLSLIPNDLKISISYHAAGSMTPAKEVGGDFFDFFRLDDNLIGVAIADVSGKGVPAALFMVMARTLLRSSVFHIDSPARVLEYMNEFLEQNNDEQLFITLFYGILNETSGTLVYSTGGHNPPIVSDSKSTRMLQQTDGMVLAMISDIDYGERSIDLEPNSRIIMMTDGIPESFNKEGEAFGDDRTLEMIKALPSDQSPEADISHIINTVETFVGEAPQFDDMTCIVLRYDFNQDIGTS